MNTFGSQQHSYSQQEQHHLTTYDKLSQIYADIDGQLCSKQSTLFNKLKNKFASLYEGLLPQKFVIVNHVVDLISTQQGNYGINMSIQNGIILLVKQTYLSDNIFINGLDFSHQLIFQSKGGIYKQQKPQQANQQINLSSQQLQLQQNMSQIIQLANSQLSLNKLYGGTIYIHSSISSSVDFFKQKILLSVYLATLIINRQVQCVNVQQMYKQLMGSNLFNDKFLYNQFKPFGKRSILLSRMKNKSGYNNNQQVEQQQRGEQIDCINLPLRYKFLMVELSNKKDKNVQQTTKMIKKVYHQHQSLLIIQEQKNNTYKQLDNKLNTLMNSLLHLSSPEQFPLVFGQLAKINNQLSSTLESINNDIKQLCTYINKQQYIVSNGYIIFCVNSFEVHQLIREVRKFINQKAETDKNNNLSSSIENPQCLQKRFTSNINLETKLFSCVPSLSIAILNPQKEMWFK